LERFAVVAVKALGFGFFTSLGVMREVGGCLGSF
jgi:hypothetical protein